MKPADYALYAIVVFGWSTSWLPLKYQLGVIPPEISLFWRFSGAAILMFIIAGFMRQKLGFAFRYHLRFCALGLCLFSANFALFYYGGLNNTSGLLAVVFSTASLVNVLMLAVLTRSLPRPLHLIAAAIGLGGVALLYLPELQGSGYALTSLALCCGGTLFFCTGNMLSASLQKDGIQVLGATCWGMLYGAIMLGIWSLVRGYSFAVDPTAIYLGGLLWLIMISSVITFTSYLTLLGRIGAGRAGYATVVFPVFALLISTGFEQYQWSVYALAGLVLVIIGNVVMVRSRG